ncbi:MAG: PKD domain-containing protein [Bacteroidota bacterium]
MVRNFYIIFSLVILCLSITAPVRAQNSVNTQSALPFNEAYWNGVADKQHLSAWERQEMIFVQKKIHNEQHSHSHPDPAELVWVNDPPQAQSKGSGGNNVYAGPCTNIDFENGTMTGWTRSTGFNPLTNALGCCPNANGDQTIMNGAGTDPYGGFPVVYPGGSFSLRLGSAATGGIADRISQTFFVTPANANFTYRYALVLNDGGHPLAQQPRFTSEIIDTLGAPVPCTFYQVSAGTNSTGINASTLTPGNGSPVSYKVWTSVLIDLTPNIGQNVTLRFTVYDCGPSGHFAYAYIDGLCTNFVKSVSDTTCPNIPVTMCAPAGFSTTIWNGPGVVNDPNLCITSSLPGTYTCNTVLIPGCPGPTFTHTVNLLANPVISFTPIVTGPCSKQYTFNSSISVAAGSITSFQWSFGDGFTSTAANPTHSYVNPGTYQVKLKAFTNRNCRDSVIIPVTVFPFPNLSFSPPSNCINTVIQFTNTSNIPVGTISTYSWTLGNGATSGLLNPTNSYSANGTYTINLSASSNQGCISSLTQTLGIFPPPVISFSASPLCDINGTFFSPSTATSIASGSLAAFLWNFGDGGTSTQANPVHIYNSPGAYTVNFTAWSNHNCSASMSNTFLISPSPTVAFSTTSVNACSPTFTFTNNSGISVGPITYTWDFGGGNTTSNASPSYTFPALGSYTVVLVGKSNMGCTDTAFQYISVYPYPVINFSVPASCEKAIFTVSTTAVSGSVTSYLWNFGDPGSGAANTSTLQNPTHFYSSTANYTINLSLLSNLNCPSFTSVPITVFPNPTAQFDYTTTNNCSLPYNYFNTSTVSTVGSSFIAANLWDVGGFATFSTTNTGLLNFPTHGSYTVNLITITNHNCSDTVNIPIVVHPFPYVDFVTMSDCVNKPINFISAANISTVPISSSISSYTWNFGDNTFANTFSPAPHNYLASGNYTVTFGATSNMNCVSLISHTLSVYPTAASDFTVSNLCLGDVTLFTSTNSISSGTIFAYNWDFGDGNTGSNPVKTHIYNSSGTFPVSFSVTTNNECYTIVTKTVTIYPLPAASFSVSSGCLNIVSSFAETSTISVGSITSYSWNFGDGGSSTNQSPNYPYTTYGNYTPTLTVISNQGCIGVATNTLVIHPLPQISFSPPSICKGPAIQFTNTSSIPLGTITSYTWDFADGSPLSTLTNPVHTYTQAGNYNILLTVTSNQGCIKTGTNTMQVHPLPQATVTPIFNACINDQAFINSNMSITSGSITTYSLSYGDGGFTVVPGPITSSTALNTHVYNAYNTYTLTLTVTSDKNCGIVVTDTIRVYPKPFVNFTSNNVCFGQNVTFNNLSNIPSPQTYSIQQHLWQFNDGSASPTSTLSNPLHLFPGTNTYTVYNVKLTEFSFPEAQNLTSTLTCSASIVKTVTIFPNPGTTFTNNSACFGSATNFSNTTGTGGITGWSWYFQNLASINSISQHASFTYPAPGIYTVHLVALNTFGCRDTMKKSIQVYTNPVASFIADSVCLNNSTTFTNTSSHGSGASSQYTWNVVGGNDFSQNSVPPPQTYNPAGNHYIKLTAKSDLGCIDTYTSAVIIHALPNVKFTASDVCLGKATQFTNQTTGGLTYIWNFGEPSSGLNNTSTAIHAAHSYSSSGTFSAKLTATSNKNCTADTVMALTVHNNPTANFLKKTVCAGDLIDISNISTSTDGTLVLHQWDFNNDNLTDQSAKTPTFTYLQAGNQVVRLTVFTQYGCYDDTVQSVLVNPKAIVDFSSDNRKGCPPMCVSFKNLSSISSGSYTIEWDFGDQSPVENGIQTPIHCYDFGKYDLSINLVSDVGCRTTFKYGGYVNVNPKPVAGFICTPDEVEENEPVISLQSTASSDVTFLRYAISDGSNYYQPSVVHALRNFDGQVKPMVVQVVKNMYNCSDTVFKVIDIKPSYSIYIPNTFTPNGDGINDEFQAKGVGIIKFNMQIFDRWGHLVFETKDIFSPWDGKKGGDDIKQDTYIWKAQVTDLRGQKHYLTGHVNMIR